MSILKKLKSKFVYALTKKPKYYVHIDRVKTLQDARQIQYNNWCKVKGVYNGSYLPTNPDILKRKGWIETTNFQNLTGDKREFTRKSSGQIVRHDKENARQYQHYHWYNGNSPEEKKINKKKLPYRNKYGQPCPEKDPLHHIAPLDREYRRKNEK